MQAVDPHSQNVTLLAADGETSISVPLAAIDAFNTEMTSICVNYASQIGASFIMLLTILIMTPRSKFMRPSTILHIACLVVCLIRTALLVANVLSPFNSFYPVWSGDYSQVPLSSYHVSVTANCFSLLLTVVVELALMNQAWTMVTLWPDAAKLCLSISSTVITLMTVGWKLAFTIIQNRSVYSLDPPIHYKWVITASTVTNVISVCWFCAIFNIKLMHHLVSNRGLLPKQRALNSMEVLIMTNGILMVIPVIFAALEYGHFSNFEPGALTIPLITIILPLGTLAAQRLTRSHNAAFAASSSSNANANTNTFHSRGHAGDFGYLSSSTAPLKSSFGTSTYSGTSGSTVVQHPSILSRCEAGLGVWRDKMDPVDLELRRIDSDTRTQSEFERRRGSGSARGGLCPTR